MGKHVSKLKYDDLNEQFIALKEENNILNELKQADINKEIEFLLKELFSNNEKVKIGYLPQIFIKYPISRKIIYDFRAKLYSKVKAKILFENEKELDRINKGLLAENRIYLSKCENELKLRYSESESEKILRKKYEDLFIENQKNEKNEFNKLKRELTQNFELKLINETAAFKNSKNQEFYNLFNEYEKEKNKFQLKNKAVKLKELEINNILFEIKNSNDYKARLKLKEYQMGPLDLQNKELRKKLDKLENRITIISNENYELKQKNTLLKKELFKNNSTNIENKSKSNFRSEEKNIRSFGDKLDGSSGTHIFRENGRFGSGSSHDNYNDDYNEKDDPTAND